jgi:hypothetical protein
MTGAPESSGSDKAKRLLEGASYGPEALQIVCQAFDEVWASIQGNYGDDPAAIEAARLKLANIILIFPHNAIHSVALIRSCALNSMASQSQTKPI